MSNLQQCKSCRKLFAECQHYNTENENLCEHYEKPIDNSKMFSHWYTWNGRIGRLEYIITIFTIFVITSILSALFVHYSCTNDIDRNISYLILTLASVAYVISRYLIVVAGIKRCHDSRTSIIYAFLISCLSSSILCIVGVVAAFYLFFQKGEEETNEYGTAPQQPYDLTTTI